MGRILGIKHRHFFTKAGRLRLRVFAIAAIFLLFAVPPIGSVLGSFSSKTDSTNHVADINALPANAAITDNDTKTTVARIDATLKKVAAQIIPPQLPQDLSLIHI